MLTIVNGNTGVGLFPAASVLASEQFRKKNGEIGSRQFRPWAVMKRVSHMLLYDRDSLRVWVFF